MTFVDDVMAQLEPMLWAEDETGNALRTFVESLSNLFQPIEDYASDDLTTGAIGWSIVLDIDRAPDEVLPWLAQFVGVQLIQGLSAADQRQQISGLANMARGTIAALQAAPAPYLTGTKTVIVRERFDPANPTVDSPGYIQVITYADQTPDPLVVQASLIAQKAAGLILNYVASSGQDYLSARTNHSTYLDVKNAYGTYEGMRADEPGI
jgi:hypothetical protein